MMARLTSCCRIAHADPSSSYKASVNEMDSIRIAFNTYQKTPSNGFISQ